ncbi:hypothetical protein KP509_20G061000 [Ceratopteris richardii]|uniref:Uncharacterized protein n=1 Tax=Ceratopteris richardii TaxID=49495 RepID=A0A8T2SFN9_CERRI|nr:hypothetical protein KP509_20G061000 [Ceratopteris richardii]
MGSLVPGWDSHINGRKSDAGSSLTNTEIEGFRNRQKVVTQEHLEAATQQADERRRCHKESIKVNNGLSEASAETTLRAASRSAHEEAENGNSYKNWWTKSSSAFLNEPAIKRLEAAYRTYSAQFHVANIANFRIQTQ